MIDDSLLKQAKQLRQTMLNQMKLAADQIEKIDNPKQRAAYRDLLSKASRGEITQQEAVTEIQKISCL